MVQVYLTRRNLLTLLSKLNRVKDGDVSKCTILKNDITHPKFPASHPAIFITAVEDEVYYTGRTPGYVIEEDDPERVA